MKKLGLLLFIIFGWGVSEGFGQTVQNYNTPGSQTFVVPLGVNSISVGVWGAGGGGGGTSSGNANKGGGGGGGGYRSNNTIAVIPGETLTIIVGAGGTVGNFQNGGNGGFSRVLRGATTLITVDGGNGGIRNGAGGNGAAGDISGGNGGDGNVGGGGVSGVGGNGGNGGNGGASIAAGTSGLGNPGANPGGGGSGSRSTGNDGVNRSGGIGGNGQVRITYTPQPYLSQIISADFGSATWCPGETRDVTVTIRNVGTATWTNSSPDINIGVRWNTNGTSWNDFNVRTNANNLASGDTRVYTLTIQASDNVGGVYGSPLAAGTNNLTFDVVNEGNFWFRNNGSTVFTTPNITISSIISGLSYTNNSPTYCANQAISANSASLSTGVAASYSVSPALPAGLTLNTTTGQITGTPSTVAGIAATNYTVTATNSCGNITTRVLNIRITPAAPTGLTYTNNTITYCAGSAISPNMPSFGGGGPATNFSVSPALPPGLTLNTSNGQITGTPTTLTGVAAANYTVTASNSCGNTTRALNISIGQVAEINDMSDFTCSGTPFTVTPQNVVNGRIPAGTTYTWTAPTVSGGVTGGVANSVPAASITGTLFNPTNIAQPVAYTVTPITNGCPGPTFQVNILLNPSAAITTINREVCSNDSFTVTPVHLTNGVVPASTSYSWTAPVVSGGMTGGLAGSGNSITGTLINPTNTPQTATYTVTPITGSCVGANFNVVVTVNPKPALTAITTASCSNQPFTVNPVNGTNGLVPAGTTYAWTAPSVPAGISGGAAGTGASIIGTLTNSTNAPLNATYTVTPTSGTCVGNTFTVTVTVNPSPVIPTQTPTICSGSAFTVTPANGGATIVPTGTTYTWTVLDNANVTGESAQATAQSTISQTLTNTSTIPQTVTYTVTPVSGAAGNCVGNSFTLTVTVNPTPILNSPPPAPRCSNVSTTYTATSATPGTTFSWTRAVVTGISNAASSGANATATETLINTTANAIDVIYIYSLTANGCTNTQNVTVTVNPTPTLSSTLTPTAICSNGVFSYNPTSATSGATFTWTRAAVSGISNPAVTAAQNTNPNEVLVNTTTAPINVIYAYSITANGCTNTQNVTVSVNPTPTLNSSLTPAAVCSNSPFNYTPTSLTTGATFTWTRAAVTGISNAAVTTAQASNPNETLINTTANPVNVIYAFSITANGCTNTQNVTVRVDPTPVLSTSLTPAAICSDSPFTYSPNSATTGATFTWTRAAVTGINNAAITSPQSSNPNEVLVNSTANPIPVVYVYTITANGCTNTQNVTVTVNPTPTLTTTLTPPAICSNTAFTYSPNSGTAGASITWTRAAVTGISNAAITTPQAINPNETLINTTANPINVVYAYTLTANGCSNTQDVTVTVNPSPVLSSTTSFEICSDDSFTYTATSATTGTSFSWTRAAVAGISNAASSGSGDTVNEALINTTPNPIDVVYVFTLGANGCSTTQSVTVTVKPSPTLSSATSLQVCDSNEFSYTATSATSGVNYVWNRAAVAGISNSAATGNSATITETLINTTSAPVDVIYEFTLTVNGCSEIQNVTVTVNPTPTLSSSLTPPAVCGDETFTYTPTSNTTGAVFTWTRAAVTGISNAAISTPQSSNPSETLVNTSTNPINVTYAYTITANGCSNTQNVIVAVNPTPEISAITTAVCTGNTFTVTPVHATNGVVPTGTTYTWTVVDNPNVTGESNQNAAQTNISQTLTNTSAVPQDVVYTVTPIAGTCAGDPFTVTVTVNGDTVIDTDPSQAGEEVCFGDTFASISVVASGAAGLTYQWFSNSTASNSGGTAVSGATSSTFTPPSSSEGESYYYVVVTGPCSSEVSQISGRYLVTPTVTAVVTPLDTTPQTICPGDSFTMLTFVASGANLTYQWYSNTSASTTGGTPITGETNSDFTPTFIPGTYGPVYFYALAASDCGTVTSSVTGAFEITHATSAQANQTLCVDTPLNPVITHTTTGTTGIANNGVAGANGLPPGVSASWNAGVITISGTPTSSAGSPYSYSIPLIGACGTEVATGTITVNPKAVINNLSEAICTAGTFNILPVNATDGVIPAGTTYTWSIPTMNGGITGGAAGSGNSITGTLTNPTNSAQTAVYTVTPTSGTCIGTVFTVTITVNPSPAIPAQTATICDEETFTVSPSNGGSTRVPAGTTYTWTVVDNANVSGESNQAAAQSNISQTLSNNSNVPQNVVYTVTPLSGSCPGAPFTVTVTVNPDPEITDLTDVVCSGSPFTVIPINGGSNIVPAGTTYTWTVANNTNVSGQSAQAAAQPSISQNLTNLTDTPQDVVYTVTPRSGVAGNCIGDSFTVTVTVNPSPVIQNLSDVICSGETFTISPANGGSTIVPTGTVYTWTVVNNPNVTGESTQTSAQNNISQTLTNTSNTPQNVIYTVTPQSGSNGNCAGNPFTVTVTVNPTPSLSSTLTPMEICSNSGFTYTPTSNVAGATFTWTRAAVTGISNPAITVAQTTNPNELLINTTPNPLDVVYTYITTANGCSTTQSVTVSVKPIPVLSSTLTPAEICGNSTFTYTPSSATSGATFTWTRAAVTGISNPAILAPQASNPNEVLINTTGAAINVVYEFTTLANGCSSTQNVTVLVNPRPTLSSSLNPAAICSNTAFTYSPTSASATAAFTWTRAAVSGISNAAITTPQSANPNEVLVNTTANPIDVIYVYSINDVGCSNIQNVTVTVKPTPVLTSTLTPAAICSGSLFNYNPTTATSGTSITWTRPAVTGISNPAISTAQTVNPSETLINTTDLPINVVYVYSLTANGCTNTQNVIVTVNPTPSLSSTLTPAAVCSDATFTYTPTSATPGAGFSWTRAAVTGISNAAGNGSGTSLNETLVNITSSPINVVYTFTTTANGCSSTDNVTVRVDPRPSIGANVTRLLYDICSGESFSFTPEDGVDGIVPAGTTYSWVVTRENGNLSGANDGSGTTITGTISNSDTRRRTADYLVTPSYGGCDGTPFTVRVRVQPEPNVAPITNPAAVCNGASVGPFNFTGTPVLVPGGGSTAPTEYNWTNDNPSIGLAASGTGNIPSFTTINNGVAPVTANVTVTPFANGCNGPSQTFTITVNPTPKVTVIPDYCVVGGRVQLIANSNVPGTTWLWNTGQTTSSILVDLSGNYSVTATAPNGCTSTENISVAQELVRNGDFTAGNIVDPAGITGFNTGYMYLPDLPGVNNELIPDTGTRGYGIGTNANNYHPNFWGIDHTNNAVGPRNMMIVNGKGGNLILWEQTVTVEPNTDYYFSAWAMSINPASPARLQFAIVGPNNIPVPVGTVATLGASPTNATQAAANNYWQRFYSDPVWNSGSISGPIKIRIINLNPDLGGNDFAIDDISFGTLSTFINLTSGAGTDDQTVCQDSPINDITYTAGSGIFGPTVTGLPNGITPVWNGVTLRFSGSPTQSGTFNYTITTTGACAPATAMGTITVRSTPTAGVIAADQTVCAGEDPIAFISTTAGTGQSGSTITYRWESNTNLTTPNWTVVPSQTAATYNPPVLSATTQYRRITLATLSGLTCESVPTAPVTVTLQNTPTPGSIATDQTICNVGDPDPFTSTVAGTGDGTITYRWESAVSPFGSWSPISSASSATYDPPAGLTATTRFRRITISTLNGKACESAATAPVEVTVSAVPTAGVIAAAQTICSGDDPAEFTSTTAGTGSGSLFYIWESAVSPFTAWTEINGANLESYDAPAGLTVTTQYRRTTVSTFNGIICESAATTPVQVTVNPINTIVPDTPNPTLCLNTAAPLTILYTTTGVTGIVPQSATVDYNLPNGVTPNLDAAGQLTISGTPAESGIFNYDIPLSGGCGPTNATGTITVENPTYPFTAINVVNPATGTPPYTSTFTVFSNELTVGAYTINYSIDGINGGPDQTISVNVSSPGEFTFTSLPYSNEGTTTLTINWIKKDTENCIYYPPNNNTAVYGLGCSTEFLQTDGASTFYVPAGVFEVRIDAYEGAVLVGSETMAVIPSGAINVGISDSTIFATEIPLASATIADSLVSATGTDSRLIFYFDCNPPVQPCPGLPPYQYIDSEGYTVIRFDVGACEWNAPDGLDEFEVLIVGGGGGGGFGSAAGGGGGGAVMYQKYTGITMNGLPGLQGAVFPLSVGTNGAGAIAVATKGATGDISTFDGPLFEYDGANTFSSFIAEGGGGGGSTSSSSSIREGGAGASGGGGAAYQTTTSSGGSGLDGNPGGNAYADAFGAAGAGGGGVTLAGEPGSSAAGGGEMHGGNGGSGRIYPISGEDIYYGAGGGATSSGAITNYAGTGGSSYTANSNSYFAGGNATNNGMGLSGTTYGSGGGAGRLGGGAGFPGVIYVRYPNFRILPVEYLYFNAQYNAALRSGDLTWATAKEWENDSFEIERSVNNVQDWEEIGKIAGAGYSEKEVKYDYSDSKLPLAGGNIFYRLKQYDFDGKFTYSDIRSIKVEPMPGITRWKVFPNPTTGYPFNIEILDPSAYQDEPITLRIISATGQFETIKVIEMSQMGAQVSEWFTTKAAGIYTIEIAWGAQREYHKVVLRR